MNRFLILSTISTLVLVSQLVCAETRYTVKEVIPDGIVGFTPVANAINDASAIAGSYLNYASGSDYGKNRGFVIVDGYTHDLPVINCTVSSSRPDACNTRVYGLNNINTAVGETWTSGSYWAQAFIWKENNNHPNANANGMVELMPGFNWSFARDINDQGFVVGNFRPPIYANRAFLHHENNAGISQAVHDLGTLGGYGGDLDSTAYAINNQNEVVGFSEISIGQMRATLWRFSQISAGDPLQISGEQMIDLGLLPSTDYSVAKDINNNSQVIGFTHNNSTGKRRGFLWQNGVITDIGDMCENEDCTTEAKAINDSGNIVGSTSVRVQPYPWWPSYTKLEIHAFVVQDGVMHDLNDLVGSSEEELGNSKLTDASAINSNGEIVARASNKIFILSPSY